MKTLYKKDSKEKIRILNIWNEDGVLCQEYGILGGKLILHSKQCNSKNVGKSNETSPSEQADLELESEYKAKLTEGYFETIEEAKTEVVILPMLAKSYEDEKHKIDWSTAYVQPKLDGMRCLAHIKTNGDVTLISREGKIIENMQHIINDLCLLKQEIILDGELYGHGLTFQENMKLIKKLRPETNKIIKYHIYDIVSDNNFITRNNIVNSIRKSNSIEIVATVKCESEIWLKNAQTINISKGYEGTILRWGNKPYKVNGRSENLLKYKEFSDIDCKIINVTPNEANSLHGTPHFQINGKYFKAGVKMSHEDREDLLTNKNNYIGKIANIRYFELTDDGVPRFPVMVGIHADR